MKDIFLTVDGQRKKFNVEGSENLRDILRQHNYTSVKCGCDVGECGCCTVVLDGKPVPSCKIPIGILHENDIMTLEYFKKDNPYKTGDTYNDIKQGFSKAGFWLSLCGFCNAGKIFAAENIISKGTKPSDEIIFSEIDGLAQCCTDTDTLLKGIKYAVEAHSNRLEQEKKRQEQEKKRLEQEKNGK